MILFERFGDGDFCSEFVVELGDDVAGTVAVDIVVDVCNADADDEICKD